MSSRSRSRRPVVDEVLDVDDDDEIPSTAPPPAATSIKDTTEEERERSKNTFKILVATDVHLGYADFDARREDDSFNTFEEILEMAKTEDVDFLLLGGDLFHENKPKPGTLRRATDMLRRYCLGDKPVQFEYLGDPKRDFRGLENPEVNYYSPHINIGLPVFTIHGNHDDPIGSRKTSAVDQLSAAGLLNHFGQYDSLNEVDIHPVLLEKGETKLSLYGLGCMKDERLFRLLRDKKVQFLRESSHMEDWFNIFVLHQNRVKHGPTNYIPPNYFPSFLNLVVWGHEHECRLEPEIQTTGCLDGDNDGDNSCYISQPGSSVATSLSPGEAVEKAVGVLLVNKKEFKMIRKKLQTVRPFLMDDLYTGDILVGNVGGKDPDKYVEKYVEARIKQLVEDSADLLTAHPKQPVDPLIRIRIDYDDESEIFNPVRFAQKFTKTVANDDIVMFKKRVKKAEKVGSMDAGELHDMIMTEDPHDLEGHVEEIVESFFTAGRQNNEIDKILEILSEKGLSEGVKACVEKNDKDAIGAIIDQQIEKVVEHLSRRDITRDSIDDELEAFREARCKISDQDVADAHRVLSTINKLNKHRKDPRANDSRSSRSDGDGGGNDNYPMGSDEENGEEIVLGSDSDDEMPAPSTRGRGRGSRAPRGGRGTTIARGTRGSRATSRPRATSRSRGGF